MADTHRTMTIAYDAMGDAGMTLDEISDRLHAMKETGIPGDAIVKIDVRGPKGEQTIGALIASDRPAQ